MCKGIKTRTNTHSEVSSFGLVFFFFGKLVMIGGDEVLFSGKWEREGCDFEKKGYKKTKVVFGT